MPVLKVHDGTDWRKVGCGTHPYGRLKLWDGTQWVADRCSSSPPVFADTFNRANGPLPGSSTTTGSATWVTYRGGVSQFTVTSNQADPPQAGGGVLDGFDSGMSNLTVSVKIATLPAGAANLLGAAFRVSDGNNFYNVVVNPAGSIFVNTVIGGAYTSLPLSGSGSGSLTAGQVLSASVNGTSGTVLVDGVLRKTFTASALTSATKVGLYTEGDTSGALDDFTVSAPSVAGRPLKMWDGTSWVTVACMVP